MNRQRFCQMQRIDPVYFESNSQDGIGAKCSTPAVHKPTLFWQLFREVDWFCCVSYSKNELMDQENDTKHGYAKQNDDTSLQPTVPQNQSVDAAEFTSPKRSILYTVSHKTPTTLVINWYDHHVYVRTPCTVCAWCGWADEWSPAQ